MWPTLHPGDVLWVRLAPTELQPGDIALFRRDGELFSHRFLGFRRHEQQRFYLAKGDGHWAFDPLWPEQTFFGVAESVERDGVIQPIAALHPWQRWLRVGVGLSQGVIHRWRHRLFLLVLTLILLTTVTEAAVTLVSFTATFQGEDILLRWETASEVNALGFNLYRSLPPSGEEILINPDIIPAQGEITGAVYQFLDENPPSAPGYQYRLEEIDANGQLESFTPVVLNRATATATPSATPTSIPSATPTATVAPLTNTPTISPTPTRTPASTASFTATPTPTASPTTPTVTPAVSPTSTANPTTAASPTPAFTSTSTPPSTAPPDATALPTLTPTPAQTTPATPSTPIAATPASATPTASASSTATVAAIVALPAATLSPLRFPDADTTIPSSTGRNPNLIYGLVGILSLLGAGILVGILIHQRGRWSR